MTNKWTEQEDQYVRDNYPLLGSKIQMKGRTAGAIVARARGTLKVYSNYNRKFTQESYQALLSTRNIKVLEEYITSKIPINHKCLHCSSVWKDPPVSLTRVRSTGCPTCNLGYGYDLHKDTYPKSAILYLVEVHTKLGNFIKIGITCRSLSTRLSELKQKIQKCTIATKIDILFTVNNTGVDIQFQESQVLKSFPRYTIPNLVFSGSTEMLSVPLKVEVLKYLNPLTRK
jgi:hypothetical protein